MFDTIAIDWGHKRYGLSYGDSSSLLVIPDKQERYTKQIFADLEEVFTSKSIKTIVVGIPTNFQLQSTAITSQIKEFTKQLKEHFPDHNIQTINERGTTAESKEVNRFNKHYINHLSSSKILERYFYKTSPNRK